MYKSGQKKRRGKGIVHGTRERAKDITDHPNHIYNKPHALIAASHHPEGAENVPSDTEESEE